MRKCNGFYYRYNNGKNEKVDFVNGKFHGYGIDWEEVGGYVGMFTTAVIEMPDGVMLNVPVVNIKFTSPDGPGACNCLTIETDDADHFRERIRAYTSEGYTVSSTGCDGGRWKAIMVRGCK